MKKLLASILWLALVLSGCSSGQPEVNEPTATARAARAQALATRMAHDLQATLGTSTDQATATARALTSLADTASQWTVVISDTFDQNDHEWKTGSDSDPNLAALQWNIAGGKYQWKAQAKDSFVWWVTPTMEDVSNFYLSADVQKSGGPADGEYGLVFRQSGDHNYYLFEINDKGQYAVYYHEPDNWEALLDWTDSESILPGQVNRIAVIAQGESFRFFINNQYLTGISDSRLAAGKVGLLVGLSNANDQAAWEFDNFSVRQP